MNQNEPARDEVALKTILEKADQSEIRLYRNVINQPYVLCNVTSEPAMDFHLFSKDFRGWLANFIWRQLKFILREREVDRVLEVLSGITLANKVAIIGDPALLQCVESEPVVATILEFMHDKNRHERRMDSFWKELEKFGRERGLLLRGRNHFPAGSNVLSRKLKQLRPVLAALGIEVEIGRSNGCRVILTRRLDDSDNEPSAQPSCHKPNGKEQLPTKDDKAERLARLQSKRDRSNKGENNHDDNGDAGPR
jgi:hypothetical protein